MFALQIKGRWGSNIIVWFPFVESQKWNCYFQNRVIMFCLPVPTLIYPWEIYIFPGSVCLFCCREICGLILEIYKSLTDTWMWKLGLRPCNSQKRSTLMGFSLQCDLLNLLTSGDDDKQQWLAGGLPGSSGTAWGCSYSQPAPGPPAQWDGLSWSLVHSCRLRGSSHPVASRWKIF